MYKMLSGGEIQRSPQSSIVPVFDEKLHPILNIFLLSDKYSRAYPIFSICWSASLALPSLLNSNIYMYRGVSMMQSTLPSLCSFSMKMV